MPVSRAEAEEVIRQYKKALDQKRKARPFGGYANIAKVLLTVMDGRKIYNKQDLYVILMQHGYSCRSADPVTVVMVRDGYAERVSWGKYRKLKNYTG